MSVPGKRLVVATIALLLAASTASCSSGGGGGSRGGDGQNGKLTIWTHNAGNKDELGAVEGIVKAFNESQSEVTVSVQAFPQGSYNDSIVSAASAGNLPCIIDADQPNVPNWAWAKYLIPLDLETDLATMLPATVGKWNDKAYSVGYYDVALGLYARKSVLEANGIRQATMEQPWTKAELDAALATLKATGNWEHPLDIATSDVGEWYPYAFSPHLQSFGGDLIDRDGFQSAEGVLNGPEAIAWAEWMRSLVNDEFIALKSGQDSSLDFVNGKSALLYGGSWMISQHGEQIGDDLAIMPTVDLGKGPKIGGGSWQWGVTAGCGNTKAAMDYLDFSLQAEQQASVASAVNAIPASEEAAQLVPAFTSGGQMEIFRDFSKEYTVMRPETPAYLFIATEFTKATSDILNGGDPKAVLDKAVANIDSNIKSNGGYK